MFLFLSLTIILSACKYSNKTISETPAEEPAYEVFKINIYAECVSNDSVGNEWVQEYFMDGQRIYSGHQITLPLNEPPVFKTITATIEEVDKYPDISSKDISFEIKDGKESHKTVVVTEGDGCHKGREAVWNVKVSVEKLLNEELP